MPYIATQVSCPLTHDTEKTLKAAFGEAISSLPGKTEEYLMLSFTERARLWFGGSDAPAAMIEVSVFGSFPHAAAGELAARLTGAVSDTLLIPRDRIYVKFSSTSEWGWGGEMF